MLVRRNSAAFRILKKLLILYFNTKSSNISISMNLKLNIFSIKSFLIIIYLSIFIIPFQFVDGTKDASRLFEDLLSDYNKLVRPVDNTNDTVVVNFKLKLSQLLDVHEKNQIMTTNVWLQHSWIDSKLKWDPGEYGGVDVLYVPSDLIWLPDVVLYNNADGNYQVSIMTKAKLSPNGTVEWAPPAIYKSMCQIDIEWFPFDLQTCHLIFGSWTYGGLEVNLKHKDWHLQREEKELVIGYDREYNETVWIVDKGIDLSDYYPSVEWDILNVPGKRHEKRYPCCESPFIDLTYEIHLRRKTLFYTVNLIFPSVGISFLTALVFYLPSDGGEKISLCISILISLTVFFLLLVEIIPSTSLVIPLIGKYLLFTMVMVTLSVIVTVITLNIHFRSPSTHTMPKWVRKVFIQVLPYYLLMRRPKKVVKEEENEVKNCKGILKNAMLSKQKKESEVKKNSSSRRKSSFGVDRKFSMRQGHTSALFEQMDYLSPHYITNAMNSSSSSSSIINATGSYIDTSMNINKTQPFGSTFGILTEPSNIETNNNINLQQPQSISKKEHLSVNGQNTGTDNTNLGGGSGSMSGNAKLYTPIQSAVDSVTYIADHLRNEEENQQVIEDWKYVSVVMDRIFLMLFTFFCITGIIVIILRAPTIYDRTEALA
uniref:Acetylcholine receptor subunit alpha-type unc-63 (inferred by orthology to a C. elegans protein) n=1 Tax=Strongyloides venezuelensis TaxID=75913 RepID=A0A0K0FIA6_STRVS